MRITLGVCVLAVSTFQICLASPLYGVVERVKDGDTVRIRLADGTRDELRLAGIDAPERKQPYGHAAGRRLAALCLGKTVEADGRKRDRYERLVARIRCEGTDPSSVLLEEGLAWHYRRYEREQPRVEREADEAAENAARAAKKGLWADFEPEAPWDYRKRMKEGRK
jgi:endonuclease YncB( thermonuclease family)